MSQDGQPSQATVLPLRSFGSDSLPMLEVNLAGRVRPFILDLGAGITVISKPLCDTLGCRPAGRMAGVRHTGELLELRLATVPLLQVGPITLRNLTVATFDLAPWQQVAPVSGVLSLQVLDQRAFILDLSNHRLIVDSTQKESAAANRRRVSVALIREHPSALTLAVPVFLSDIRIGWGTIDTGSPQTYLHSEWTDLMNRNGELRYVREQRGWTGQRDSVQYWSVTRLAVLDSTATQDSVVIAVKRMVPDGLIGLDWLRRRVLSCDLKGPWCEVQ